MFLSERRMTADVIDILTRRRISSGTVREKQEEAPRVIQCPYCGHRARYMANGIESHQDMRNKLTMNKCVGSGKKITSV